MKTQTRIEILSHQTINSQFGRYIAWPCIAKTQDGDLLVVFSGDRDGHVCPFGTVHMIRSSDGGETWSRETIVNDSPLDDRDAGIMVTDAGTVIVRWFVTFNHPDLPSVQGYSKDVLESWRPHTDRLTPMEIATWTNCPMSDAGYGRRGYWSRRSTDGGHTWSAPIPTAGSSPKPPAQLADGSLLMIGNAGYDRVNRTTKIVVERSTDDGLSWRVIARLPMFPDDDGTYLAEPHLVEAEPGHIVAFARSERVPSSGVVPRMLYQADSFDNGLTWTAWQKTAINGKPPHLLKLRDGRLLATYGRRIAPFGQRAVLSDDNGKTWDTDYEFILRDDAPNADLGYPATVELDDGQLATVYYQCERDGAKPVIMLTRWRLND